LEYLTREEVTQYIIHASILVMVRSKDLQSQASYPSKLSEFLASSKPVISVNVGEIPLYLKDGEHAFLVEAGDTKGLTEKLEYVWNNYDLALEVGQKGRQLTETVFNYSYQAKRMIEFISSLNGEAPIKEVV
jgi:glycosyltransferase involved in cell wall biosynthesis